MNFYIAGKITGLPNYRELFNKVEKELNDKGHNCMNPSILPEGFPWEIYMPICYAMIDACDSIYLLKNWVDSKGAKLEYDYAVKNNKKIFYEPTNDSEGLHLDWKKHA